MASLWQTPNQNREIPMYELRESLGWGVSSPYFCSIRLNKEVIIKTR